MFNKATSTVYTLHKRFTSILKKKNYYLVE